VEDCKYSLSQEGELILIQDSNQWIQINVEVKKGIATYKFSRFLELLKKFSASEVSPFLLKSLQKNTC
jgi:hypothetical protein